MENNICLDLKLPDESINEYSSSVSLMDAVGIPIVFPAPSSNMVVNDEQLLVVEELQDVSGYADVLTIPISSEPLLIRLDIVDDDDDFSLSNIFIPTTSIHGDVHSSNIYIPEAYHYRSSQAITPIPTQTIEVLSIIPEEIGSKNNTVTSNGGSPSERGSLNGVMGIPRETVEILNSIEFNEINKSIKNIIISYGSCNKRYISEINLNEFPHLVSFVVKERSLKHVNKLIAVGCSFLVSIYIESYCFTSFREDNTDLSVFNGSGCMVMDCPLITSIMVLDYSFVGVEMLTILNLPHLSSIQIGRSSNPSHTFHNASLYLENAPLLREILIGPKCFNMGKVCSIRNNPSLMILNIGSGCFAAISDSLVIDNCPSLHDFYFSPERIREEENTELPSNGCLTCIIL